MKLSVIIVNYNTYTLTKQTIDSILCQKLPFAYEILLVDNASADESMKWLEEDYQKEIADETIHCLRNEANLGFSKANNRGIRVAKGEYILLLNSDTYVVGDALQQAIDYIETANKVIADKPINRIVSASKEEALNKIGALGVKVKLADGTLDHACKRGFPTPQASLYYFLGLNKKNPQKYGQYHAAHLDENEVGEVDCLTGAFMLMPREMLDEVGLLDENLFMYGEDVDLCYRIKEAGYRIMYYPKVEITHYKGGSSKKRRTKIIYDFHYAMWYFYKKHYKKQYNLVITASVGIGIWMKYALEIMKNALKPTPTKQRELTETREDITYQG